MVKTRRLKLLFRRRLKRQQRQVQDLGSQAEQQIERNLYRRFGRLMAVRRFVIGWVLLVILLTGGVLAQNLNLSHYYQEVSAVPGGIYSEGVRGRFTNANPLYAISDADATVSRLVFSGLFKYDNQGDLVGDLAQSYETLANGSTYRVRLKPNLTWHDGQPLTSADVAFTYKLIQSPDVQSPLQGSWQSVNITTPDKQTIVFDLPGVLASFPYNMTNGIVPEHILSSIPLKDLRSADFNSVKPVGAGPFKWEAVEVKNNASPKKAQQQIALEPFAKYNAGQPKLQKFVVKSYADEADMINDFQDKELTAMEGADNIPKTLAESSEIHNYIFTQRAANMVFFKTSEGILADPQVRRALVQASNVPEIIKQLDYPARQVREPLLIGQVAYDPGLAQAGHDLKAARSALDSLGWRTNQEGQRRKNGQPLSIRLTIANTPEYRIVTDQLKRQWHKLGVQLEIERLEPDQFQDALKQHNYQALLNGISIGVDPDVFVYWDSSQADVRSNSRLNFSEYNNPTADVSLEAGRTRLDPAIRAVKYKPFLQVWQQDNPALALYQPRISYITQDYVSGLTDQAVNTAADRFHNVHNWQIRVARVDQDK